MYLMNQYETMAIKSVPGIGYFVKIKGEKEVFVPGQNSVVAEIILDYYEITEEEYNKF